MLPTASASKGRRHDHGKGPDGMKITDVSTASAPQAGRRRFLAGSAALAGLALTARATATETLVAVDDLAPGQFTWHPERQPAGPVSVVVSLDQQRVHVYRNGVRIGVSTCSTGKKGHETPTGVFVVLQKDRNHRSSTYNNAPMPNMNRLTWDGIALHAGNLPGYPASHGCVRLPMAFSKNLFGITHVGTPVIIASSASDPYALTHPGPVLNGFAEAELAAAVAATTGKQHPSDWAEAQAGDFLTVLVSTADRRALVIRNDTQIDEGGITLKGDGRIGQHVFVLQPGSGGTGLEWHVVSHHTLPGEPTRTDADLLYGIALDRALAQRVARHMHPGMVMVLTETTLAPETRSGEDFVILNTDDA